MGPSDPDAPKLPASRRPRHRAAWRGAFAVSAALHILAIVVYGGISGPPTLSVSPGGEGSAELEGLELLNLVAQADEELERPDDPEEEELERLLVPIPVAAPPSDEESGGEEAGEVVAEPMGPLGPTAADRLRVRMGDARLWAPLAEEDFAEITMQQFIDSDLAWRIGLWQDSAAVRAQREADILDWTFTDDEGNKWGVSPGKLHLGSITLPLPFGFGINPGRYDDWMEQQYIDGELARGAMDAVIYETRRERADAIRARRDRERREAQEELRRAGPRRAQPDTTRGSVRRR